MKKTMLYLAALVCCMFSLTSCGDDEPDVMAVSTYTVTFTPDFFKTADVIIHYKENNENKFKALTESDLAGGFLWTKTVTSKCPAELGCKLQISAKDASELTEEKYDLGVEIEIASGIKGSSSIYTNSGKLTKIGVKAADVNNALRQFNAFSYGYIYNKDATPSNYTPKF